MHEENWVDKEFELGLPLEELPALFLRLAAVPSHIEAIVSEVPTHALQEQIGGAWSVNQHIGHLADLEELHERRLDDFEAGLTTLRPADMTNRKTEDADHNNAELGDLLSALKAVRAHFVQRLEGLGEVTLAHYAMHPRLQKPMRPVDLAYFVAEHDAHHLVAIARLCRDE